jgi:hypothetical protein
MLILQIIGSVAIAAVGIAFAQAVAGILVFSGVRRPWPAFLPLILAAIAIWLVWR